MPQICLAEIVPKEIENYLINTDFSGFMENSMMRFACIKQMEIIARIEHQFGIPLDEGKLANLETLGDFLDLINQQILISN